MCIERGTVERVATVANEKALFVTLVDRIPWFDAHWSQFFAEFDWFVVTTSCLDTYISRYGDFCANDDDDDDDDDTTDYFTPCACARGNNKAEHNTELYSLVTLYIIASCCM